MMTTTRRITRAAVTDTFSSRLAVISLLTASVIRGVVSTTAESDFSTSQASRFNLGVAAGELVDRLTANRVGRSEALLRLLQITEPMLCDQGILEDQYVMREYFEGPSLELKITTGKCTLSRNQDSGEVLPTVEDCTMPAIKYKIKDAKIRSSGISPVALEAPMCAVEYAFGPLSQEKTVFTFDGSSRLATEYGREQALRSISVAIMDVAQAMSASGETSYRTSEKF